MTDLVVRPMTSADVPEAQKIWREAFAGFLAVPERALGDSDFVTPRFRVYPETSYAAELDGQLVGSHFLASWGTFTVVGTLTVRPTVWKKGISKPLMDRALADLPRLGSRFACLFTFAQSPAHVGNWERFGFWPRYLTVVMSKPVRRRPLPPGWHRLSQVAPEQRAALIAMAGELTSSVFEGMRLDTELAAIGQGLGDAVVWEENGRAQGLVFCHTGAGTYGGRGIAYVRFAMVRGGPGAAERFGTLLDAVEGLASELATFSINVGVNTARRPAYQAMRARGFRTTMQGVAMHRPDVEATCHPEAWVLDDWR